MSRLSMLLVQDALNGKTIPPAFPSTGTYAETQSLCGQEYVSPSSTVFVYMRYFKQGSFIFDLFLVG